MNEQPECFEALLQRLINQYSLENGSNTPDFMLAEYLNECLQTWNRFITRRDEWYGVHLVPGNKYFIEDPR